MSCPRNNFSDDLPIEILTIIATQDLETFQKCLMIPGLGNRLCSADSQNYAKVKFSSVETFTTGAIYYLCGIVHREDGPAVDLCHTKVWYRYGKKHRVDGPAIEDADGSKEWWVNGKRHRIGGPAVEYGNGAEEWYEDGKLHRESGPALRWTNGFIEWRIRGLLHREDGPAVICENGDKEWYLNGKRHREDGPAIEFGGTSFSDQWFLNDERVK